MLGPKPQEEERAVRIITSGNDREATALIEQAFRRVEKLEQLGAVFRRLEVLADKVAAAPGIQKV